MAYDEYAANVSENALLVVYIDTLMVCLVTEFIVWINKIMPMYTKCYYHVPISCAIRAETIIFKKYPQAPSTNRALVMKFMPKKMFMSITCWGGIQKRSLSKIFFTTRPIANLAQFPPLPAPNVPCQSELFITSAKFFVVFISSRPVDILCYNHTAAKVNLLLLR